MPFLFLLCLPEGCSSRHLLFTSPSTRRVDHRGTGQEMTVMEEARQLSVFNLLQQELNWRKCLIWERDLGGGLILFGPEKKWDGQNAGYEGVLQEVPRCSHLLCPSHYHEQSEVMWRVYQEGSRPLEGIHAVDDLGYLELWKVINNIFKQHKCCVFGWERCLGLSATWWWGVGQEACKVTLLNPILFCCPNLNIHFCY